MSDRILAATRKGLVDFRRTASCEWQIARTSFLGSPVSMTLRDPRDGMLYAALDLGHFGAKFHRSGDDGQTWEEVAVPSYADISGDDPPSLKVIWSLEAGGPDELGVLWAGTLPGGLFKSEDRGKSWTLNRSLWDRPERAKWFGGGYDLPGIHSIAVHPSDSKTITIAVSCGGLWETKDGGETWVQGGKGLRADFLPPDQAYALECQDVHRLVRCRDVPDTLWLQHHNGAWRSDIGFAEVEEIKPEPTVFGFAVACHPADPKTAWFAPAVKDEFRYPKDGRLVVSRTRDGGKSFEQLSAGLPQSDCFDLVYRHGLEVDETGERLVMASTTGNLWVSEDGGEGWAQINGHLPPVYAVRFG